MAAVFAKDVMYDMPVSNHGARARIIIKTKRIEEYVEVKSVMELGGLKTPEFLALNALGKMPVLLCDDGTFPLCESDTICRYLLQKYSSVGPTFLPSELMQAALSEQLIRLLDVYIGPLQGCLYKATGTPFSTFGTDRKAALEELKKQLLGIEVVLDKFAAAYPHLTGEYLCGKEISLADASIFPSMVFFDFMLPQFFSCSRSEFMGPRLQRWWEFMCSSVPAAADVKSEIDAALLAWKEKGRWDPIVAELKAATTD